MIEQDGIDSEKSFYVHMADGFISEPMSLGAAKAVIEGKIPDGVDVRPYEFDIGTDEYRIQYLRYVEFDLFGQIYPMQYYPVREG